MSLPQDPPKNRLTRLSKRQKVYLSLAFLSALAWVASATLPAEYQWSKDKAERCGRLASSGGALFFQSCSLKPRDGLPDSLARKMPPDFQVGLNVESGQTLILCGPVAVPFARHAPRGLWGFAGRSMQSRTEATQWSSSWVEVYVTYWLLLVCFLLGAVWPRLRAGMHNLRERWTAQR